MHRQFFGVVTSGVSHTLSSFRLLSLEQAHHGIQIYKAVKIKVKIKLFYWRTSLNVGLNLGVSLFVHALLGIAKYYQYQTIRSKYLFWISDTEVRFLPCWGTQVTYSSLKSSSFESSANHKLQIQIAALPSLYLYLLVIGNYPQYQAISSKCLSWCLVKAHRSPRP